MPASNTNPTSLSNIAIGQFATIDYSRLGMNGGARTQKAFSISNSASSTDASIPLRVGSMLGQGGIPNDAGTKIYDYQSRIFGKSVSAIDYDTTSLVSSDSIIGVGSVQAFSEYTCHCPCYIFKMTVTSEDATQLNSSVTYNYIRPDNVVINAGYFTAAQTLNNRPPSGSGNVNVWLDSDLGDLCLTPTNFLEFTSYDGKAFVLTFDIGAVQLVGDFVVL